MLRSRSAKAYLALSARLKMLQLAVSAPRAVAVDAVNTPLNQTDEDVAEHFLTLQQFFGHTSNEIPANNMPANDLGLNGFADFVEASVELQTE